MIEETRELTDEELILIQAAYNTCTNRIEALERQLHVYHDTIPDWMKDMHNNLIRLLTQNKEDYWKMIASKTILIRREGLLDTLKKRATEPPMSYEESLYRFREKKYGEINSCVVKTNPDLN